jgi:hypothetical protein
VKKAARKTFPGNKRNIMRELQISHITEFIEYTRNWKDRAVLIFGKI